MLAEITNITFSYPNWFYAVMSFTALSMVFILGMQWCKVREICKEFPKIRRALDVISQMLVTKNWTDAPLYVSAQSPNDLTDEGKKMLQESGFEEFYNANKVHFFKYIANENPKTEAEVENSARNLMLYLNLKTTPKIEIVENFAYSIGRPLPSVLYAYSIEIRDRYIKEKLSLPQ